MDCERSAPALVKAEDETRNLHKRPMSEANMFQLLFAIALQDLEGTQEQKVERLHQRLINFFPFPFDLRVDNFFPRLQPDYSDPTVHPVDNSIIIFGVEFMSPSAIKKLFASKTRLKWINNSNVRVTFESGAAAEQGILRNLKEADQILKMDEESADENESSCEVHCTRSWMELKPYYEMKMLRKRFCRYATSAEMQTKIQTRQSKEFQAYLRAKSLFLAQLQENYFERIKVTYHENQKAGMEGFEADDERERSREKRHSPRMDQPRTGQRRKAGIIHERLSCQQLLVDDISCEYPPPSNVIRAQEQKQNHNEEGMSLIEASQRIPTGRNHFLLLEVEEQDQLSSRRSDSNFHYARYINEYFEQMRLTDKERRQGVIDLTEE